ncbi:GntR family transcriptional regulator [Arthrobacter wenxiniae]|uniref:GntR family transcriptional regulator n=1 Tax=Arthrobacter wenxiniae TaxID=2713570 RepID=A0A7Y7LY72_9MICC|nr:GntR family transcriptional regulator [Arthrobacter wenxiniae]NVM95155.1 GntR family transcriptional regulator [Arthrobacter wenxiniae]
MQLHGGYVPQADGNANAGVVERLREAIVRGEIEPGERIREAEVASQLGVSRTPVREAFLVLAAEGLLTLQPGKGAHVRVYSAEDIRIVHEVRSLVEGCAAKFAADRISNQQLDLLRESCERLEALPDGAVSDCNEENLRFHNLIFSVVGNAQLMHVARHLLEVPLPYKRDYWSDPARKRRSELAHRRVYAALLVRDALAAEEAMREHVADVGQDVSQVIAN